MIAFFGQLRLGIILVPVVVLLVLAAWIMARRAEKMRRLNLQKWAKKQGYTYHKSQSVALAAVAGVYPANTGMAHRARDVIRGDVNGQQFLLFHWEHTWVLGHRTGRGFNRVIALRAPEAPAHVKIHTDRYPAPWQIANSERISFENKEFNDAYKVLCANRRIAHGLVDAQMIEWLLTQPHADWHWVQDTVVVRKVGKLHADFAAQLLQEAIGFEARIPRHLRVRS